MRREEDHLASALPRTSSGYCRLYCCLHRNLAEKRAIPTQNQISIWKQDQIRWGGTEMSGSGVREFLEGVDDGVDLGDNDREALEQHRSHELAVAPFLRRRRRSCRGWAEASRLPEKRPEQKASRSRRSGQHGGERRSGSGGPRRAATVVWGTGKGRTGGGRRTLPKPWPRGPYSDGPRARDFLLLPLGHFSILRFPISPFLSSFIYN
jgi:hypothetical protein